MGTSLLLFLMLALPPSEQSGSALTDAQSTLQQARGYFQKQEWDKARAAAGRALQINPRLAEAEVLLGLVDMNQSQLQQAEKHMLNALSLQPRSALTHGYLGSIYFQQHRLTEASRAFHQALQLNPASPLANYYLGLLALTQQKPADALPYFEKVHRINPSDIPPLTGLLESQLRLKRRAAARLTAQELKRLLKPDDPRLFKVASLLAVHNDFASAIPLLEQIRQVFPDSYDVQYNLALAYFRYKNYPKAADALQVLLKQHPRAEAYNLLAMVEEQEEHYLEAVRSFQKAAELEPGNEDYRYDYAFELLKHQTDPAAIAIFASGVRDFPGSFKLHLGLGCAYYVNTKHEEAARTLLEAIKIEPNNKLAYLILGKSYAQAGSLQAAVADAFRAYVEGGPQDPWAYYHYGMILYLSTQSAPKPESQAAKAYLHRALSLNPRFAEANLQLGIILLHEDQGKESLRFFEDAIQSDPKLATARYQLGLAYRRLGENDKAAAQFALFEKLNAENQAGQENRKVIQFLVEQERVGTTPR